MSDSELYPRPPADWNPSLHARGDQVRLDGGLTVWIVVGSKLELDGLVWTRFYTLKDAFGARLTYIAESRLTAASA